MSCSVCAGYSSYNCPCCGHSVEMTDCPECNGTGYAPHKALQIHTRQVVTCSALTWDMLPADEDTAYSRGENWCKYPREACPVCKGEGEIAVRD